MLTLSAEQPGQKCFKNNNKIKLVVSAVSWSEEMFKILLWLLISSAYEKQKKQKNQDSSQGFTLGLQNQRKEE